MKKQIKLSTLTIATFTVLVACNNDEPSASEETNLQSNESEETTSEVNEETSEEDEATEDESDSVLARGSLEDQLDLSIGDTGTVETTIGTYSITVNEVEILNDIEDELPELDYFILVNYTVKNEGEEDIDAADSIGVMEFTDDLEVSGFPDDSQYFDSLDNIEGTLAPGEELTGQAIYEAYENQENYLRITGGLVASGAAKNDIRFTFEKSEIE